MRSVSWLPRAPPLTSNRHGQDAIAFVYLITIPSSPKHSRTRPRTRISKQLPNYILGPRSIARVAHPPAFRESHLSGSQYPHGGLPILVTTLSTMVQAEAIGVPVPVQTLAVLHHASQASQSHTISCVGVEQYFQHYWDLETGP